MSSSTSDLSLFSSFEKDSTDQQTTLGLATAASNLSSTAADTAIPGNEVRVKISCTLSAVITFVTLQLFLVNYCLVLYDCVNYSCAFYDGVIDYKF